MKQKKLEMCDVRDARATDCSRETKKNQTPQPPGSIIVILPPGVKPRLKKLTDITKQTPQILTQI